MAEKEKAYPLKMPVSLHRAVKTAAAQSNGKTMNDIINEATAKFLGVTLRKGGNDHEPNSLDKNSNVHMG